MGMKVQVPQAGIYNLIDQAYQAGGEYQWAREALVNSIQAEATWVQFGIDRQGIEKQGVARRYVADNGVGMNQEDMKLFLSSFGGGGRSISITENFGQGFKASCYKWNPYGIVVMSWTQDNPEGAMIWIYLNQQTQEWELKDFDVPEVDDYGVEYTDVADCVLPHYNEELGLDLRLFKTEEIKKAGQGTVFLFLGDSKDRETAHGDYNRNENTIRGIVKYLNSRFVDIPEGITVGVTSLESKAAKDETERRESRDNFVVYAGSGKRSTLHSRTVKGVMNSLPSPYKSGTVKVRNDTEIDWYLTEALGVKGDGSYGPSAPFMMVKYENEAYNRYYGAKTFRRFGISDTLDKRVWLVIKPPKYDQDHPTRWGVMPQASRGTLIAKGGTDLPWNQWEDDFWKSMPKEISDAMAEASSGESSSGDEGRRERLKRTTARLSTRMRPRTLVHSEDGSEKGTPSGDHTGESREGVMANRAERRAAAKKARNNKDVGGNGKVDLLDADEDGDLLGKMRPKGDGIPAICWDSSFPEEELFTAARYDKKDERNGSRGTIHMNLSFPMFVNEFKYWGTEWPRASDSELIEVIKQVYEDEIVSKVMHAHKMRGQVVGHVDSKEIRINNAQIEEWTSPESLTASLLGLTNVESRIRVLAGGKFGSAASKSTTKAAKKKK